MVTRVPSVYVPEDGVTCPCPLATMTCSLYSALQATAVISKSDTKMVTPNSLNTFNMKHLWVSPYCLVNG